MQQQEIMNKLEEIITPYMENTCTINMDSDILNDLSINSFDFVNVIMEIENVFECEITNDEMNNIRLVKDIVQHIILSKT